MLSFHHVGLLVQDIELQINSTYGLLFGKENISEKIYVSSQKVFICLIKTGIDSFIELIQPLEEGPLDKLLKKGIVYYHMAYLTDNFHEERVKFLSLDFKALNEFNSEAFNGNKCQFFYSSEGHLIELIEK